MKKEHIANYIIDDFKVDGNLSKDIWKKALWSDRFVDTIGNTPAFLDSRSAVLFSDDYLYIGFYAESPYPKANLKNNGDLLWFDSNVEVFIDGNETLYELQLNALNTKYEAFYIWCDAYKENPIYRKAKEFDVIKNDARVFGGNHDRTGLHFWNGSHPRGNRWTFLNYGMRGLETAVKVDGKLNDDSVLSNCVMYEIKIPWSDMKWLTLDRTVPPKDGDIWKMFFGRFENLRVNGSEVGVGWSLDCIGTNDNHQPEKFSEIKFVK